MIGTNPPRYADLDDLRDYLGLPAGTATTSDGLLQDCLVRAERAIDSYTRRNFAGTAGTAYYNRFTQGQQVGNAFYLEQDLHTLTSLTLGNGQSVPIGSVWLEPRNAGPPYRILRLHSQFVYSWNTDADMAVAGTWGFGTVVPDDIAQATIRTAAYYFRSKDSGFGQADVAGFPQAGELPVTQGLPQDVRWLLSPYRSRSGGVV